MNILIEGWRNINHSFALVNQWQIMELIKSNDIFFKDVPYISKDWDKNKNSSGLEKNVSEQINNLPLTESNQNYDITYRISFPFNFNKEFNSKILVVFGNCEYKKLKKEKYIHKLTEEIKNNKNFFIHTPSNWSKEGYLKAGFKNNQIIVVPHGVDKNVFYISSSDEKIKIRNKYGIKDDEFVLTNIGAMTENKGVEILIAAYGILKKKFDNLRLILKDQSNLYGIKTNYLFDKIKNSKFNQKHNIINEKMMKDIKIISENLNLNEIRNLYTITDCYVSPYLAEGFNLTPLEAAACGTQIIVTKGGSTDDYFNECLGFQIESKLIKMEGDFHRLEPEIESLINILKEKIINKKDGLEQMRSDFVHKNFSWKSVVKKLTNEFEIKLRQ